mgnify:CR=1 FL=1
MTTGTIDASGRRAGFSPVPHAAAPLGYDAARRLHRRPLSAWLVRLTGPLSIAALAMAASTGAISAQVTFEQVEAALVALEASAGPTRPQGSVSGGQDGAGSGAVATLPPAPTTLPPHPHGQEQDNGNAGAAEFIGGLEFLPILEGQECPQAPQEITVMTDRLAQDVRQAEAEVIQLNGLFEILEEDNGEHEVDRDLTECPEDFVEDVEAFLEDLVGFALLDRIQATESLAACTQVRFNSLQERMNALAASTDPNAGAERLFVGRLLENVAVLDDQVITLAQDLTSLNLRRQRLESSALAMLRRCEVLSGF